MTTFLIPYLIAFLTIGGISIFINAIMLYVVSKRSKEPISDMKLEEAFYILNMVVFDYKLNILNKKIAIIRSKYELDPKKKEQSIHLFNKEHDALIKEAIKEINSLISDEMKLKLLNYFSYDGLIYHIESKLISEE